MKMLIISFKALELSGKIKQKCVYKCVCVCVGNTAVECIEQENTDFEG